MPAEVVEAGERVKDFKPGDRVLVPAIAQTGTPLFRLATPCTPVACYWAGSSPTSGDGVFPRDFHVTTLMALAHMPEWHDQTPASFPITVPTASRS